MGATSHILPSQCLGDENTGCHTGQTELGMSCGTAMLRGSDLCVHSCVLSDLALLIRVAATAWGSVLLVRRQCWEASGQPYWLPGCAVLMHNVNRIFSVQVPLVSAGWPPAPHISNQLLHSAGTAWRGPT